MRKILSFIFMTVILCGCSKPQVQTSWEISAIPKEDNKFELKSELQKITKTAYAIWVKVEVEKMNVPTLVLKPGEQAEDIIPEPDISRTMKSKASFDEAGEIITFELCVEYENETYSTNGVIKVQK